MGPVDALTAGLSLAGQRPWLALLPLVVDLVLWLAPRLSVAGLAQRFLTAWETLVRAAYTPDQLAQLADMLEAVRATITQVGAQANLAETITGHWLSAPSAIAAAGATRLTFISDTVLAPAGLSPTLARLAAWAGQGTVEVTGVGSALLILTGLWLAGQAVAAFYLHWVGQEWRAAQPARRNRSPATAGDPAPLPEAAAAALPPFSVTLLRLVIFNIALGIIGFILRVPLGMAVAVMMLAGSSVAGIAFIFVGGITLWLLLWFLTACFFVSEAIVLDGQSVSKATLQSATLVRGDGVRAFGLVALINLLMLGFRAIWGLAGQNPAGVLVAMVGNAYLTTGIVLAVYSYYDNLRTRWQAAMESKRVDKETGGSGRADQ
jgi:hypothetical protein